MLDREAVPLQTHVMELYTDQLLVKGSVTLPFRRVTDIMNSPDRTFFAIEGALVAPVINLQQVTGPNQTATLVRRTQVRYVATYNDPTKAKASGPEFAGVQKVRTACYGFLGPFIFHAYLHTRPGTPLMDTLELGAEQFMPLTQATVYLIAHPDLPPRQHEVIVINRAFLDVMYLA